MSIGDWVLELTGEVVRVDRENIDKSGRNPKYVYTVIVKPSATDGVPDGAYVPDEVPVRLSASAHGGLDERALEVGAQVTITAKASGARPQLFTFSKLG